MRPNPIAPLALAALLGACASGADVEPILDGAPAASFRGDLSDCRGLARSQHQLDRDTMASAAIGAGIGGVLGEADDGDALGGAIVGALMGAAAGASEASDTREAIVKDCLRGRGHRVVG
jgi:hypothetical protein